MLSSSTLVVLATAISLANAGKYLHFPPVSREYELNGLSDRFFKESDSCVQDCLKEKKSTEMTPCPVWDTGCLCIFSSYNDLWMNCILEKCPQFAGVTGDKATAACTKAGVPNEDKINFTKAVVAKIEKARSEKPSSPAQAPKQDEQATPEVKKDEKMTPEVKQDSPAIAEAAKPEDHSIKADVTEGSMSVSATSAVKEHDHAPVDKVEAHASASMSTGVACTENPAICPLNSAHEAKKEPEKSSASIIVPAKKPTAEELASGAASLSIAPFAAGLCLIIGACVM